MAIGVQKVRIGVQDQDRAKRFWVETIGCVVAQDATYGDERWLEVRLPDGVVLILEQRDSEPDPVPSGQPNSPVFFGTDDVDATFAEMSGREVRFVQEPVDMPFGRWALFEDTEGNRFPLMSKPEI
jgi:predicted enzyme related to lactoylglutathione lyase